MYPMHLHVIYIRYINTLDFLNLLLVWLMPHIVVVDLMTFLETKQTRKHFAKTPALDKPRNYHTNVVKSKPQSFTQIKVVKSIE